MIETVEQLKQERPDLVELFESMDREQLLNQIYLEVKDAVNMEERVAIFMNGCTNLSKTNYSPHVIKTLIQEKYERDISQFCEMVLEDIEGMDVEEIKGYLESEVIRF